jgi:effector-binding domain-containing protein
MIDPPQILQTAEQRAAVIRFTIPREQIATVMGPGIGELMATLATQFIMPAGPFFSHHLRMDPMVFDFELGVPIAGSVAATGRVQPGSLPGGKVARTVHRGPYDGLGAAWVEFESWIARSGLMPCPDLWESYVAGPETGPDPTLWRTELNRPLLG